MKPDEYLDPLEAIEALLDATRPEWRESSGPDLRHRATRRLQRALREGAVRSVADGPPDWPVPANYYQHSAVAYEAIHRRKFRWPKLRPSEWRRMHGHDLYIDRASLSRWIGTLKGRRGKGRPSHNAEIMRVFESRAARRGTAPTLAQEVRAIQPLLVIPPGTKRPAAGTIETAIRKRYSELDAERAIASAPKRRASA